MNLGKEELETALRRDGLCGVVERVISLEAEAAVGAGENYMSSIYRVTLRVVLGNGRTGKRSLIFKTVPLTEAREEFVHQMGVFKVETTMYTVVTKEMEMLMDEFEDTDDTLWCKLIYFEPYNFIVLEDLKVKGFKTASRIQGLDLDHALLLIRSLGRFHGMSKILEERGIITLTDYKPYSFFRNRNMLQILMCSGLKALCKTMEEQWGPEWYDTAQTLLIPKDVIIDKLMALTDLSKTKFHCLNHGDCWTNNVMFKYDWKNKPSSMRFVDLQLVHFNSPVIDLTYVLDTSVRSEVRRADHDNLINTYLETLDNTLTRYGYLGDRLTMEELQEELERVKVYRLWCLVFIHPITIARNANHFDMETILRSQGEKGLSPALYDQLYRNNVGTELKELAKFMKDSGWT